MSAKKNILFGLIFSFLVCTQLGYGQQCDIIFVSPNGSSSGTTGTKANPADLNHALNNLTLGNNDVLWLASGTYNISTSLDIINNVTIEGGFDVNTWIKSNHYSTLILKDASNPIASPERIIAMKGAYINNFRLQDIEVEVEDASGVAESTYGLHLLDCKNYTICRSSFTAGNATDGIDGSAGANGVDGVNGSQGGAGEEDKGSNACCNEGGIGGLPSYPGSAGGANGGDGGTEGTSGGWFSGGTAPPGSNGDDGSVPLGGLGGVGGQGNCGLVGQIGSCPSSPANNGTNGDDGLDGLDGSDGPNGAVNFASFFYPGDGTNGVDGEHGGGGGGGGGGGSQGCLSSIVSQNNGVGPGGGGGGEGGQGGIGASGGLGGGGSFGAYIYLNGGNSFIKDSRFNSGAPGFGGKGGFPGGMGGYAGIGAAGHGSCDNGDSGTGGDGGNGGQGGNGGDGVIGVSVQLYEHPIGTAVYQSDMKSNVEPQIWVNNTGCTFSDIEYSTNAIGLVEWYFDGGTTPLNAVGGSVTVQYANMARHSITLIVNGVPYMFTDFTGIFIDGTPYLPTIVSADTNICPGVLASFSSSYAGNTYEWVVHDSLSSITYTTANMNHAFNHIGSYLVTLQTSSDCCGKSKLDSFYVNVHPVLVPNVLVNASKFNICNGDSILFGAIPINGGNSPQFQWQINGASINGATSQSFMGINLSNGDQVSCIMTSDYYCPTTTTATSAAITVFVSNNPTISCSNSSGYLGSTTQFSGVGGGGTPTYSYQWDFGDGGTDTIANPTHSYGSTGNYSYSVTITDYNGCKAICYNSVTILSAPFVNAYYDIDTTMICGSTTAQFIDTSSGSVNSWEWDFGDGNSSNVQNPSHTYNVPGIYTVTLITSNGAYNDTLIKPNVIKVFAASTADFSTLHYKGCPPFEAQFIDASVNAVSWQWDFGDPSSMNNSATNQNPSHIYDNTGTYNISLSVFSSDGCADQANGTITVEDPPEISLPEDITYCPQESFELSNLIAEDPSYTYLWSPNDGISCNDCYTTTVYTKKDIDYILTIKAYPECEISDTIHVDADTSLCSNKVFVPSAFSPNADGINDVLYARGTNISSMNFYIYNRFGELVYQSFDMNDGWDGNHNGDPLSAEVFMYVVKAVFEDESTATRSGDVTLVR